MSLEPLRDEGHPSPLEVEDWWFAGQRPVEAGSPGVGRSPGDLAEIGAHVSNCDHCRDRVRTLESERESFLDSHPVGDLLGPALEALERSPRRGTGTRRALLAVAAVLLIGLGIGLGRGLPDRPGLRARGAGADLLVLVHDTGRWLPAAERTPRAGDEVRWSVRLEEPAWPLIVLEQSDGERFVAWPARLAEQVEVPAGGPVILEGAAVLDDFAGREELSLFLGDQAWTSAVVDGIIAGTDGRQPAAHTVLREGR
jgi:hypothetical protein